LNCQYLNQRVNRRLETYRLAPRRVSFSSPHSSVAILQPTLTSDVWLLSGGLTQKSPIGRFDICRKAFTASTLWRAANFCDGRVLKNEAELMQMSLSFAALFFRLPPLPHTTHNS
jgi:hypothetical protein